MASITTVKEVVHEKYRRDKEFRELSGVLLPWLGTYTRARDALTIREPTIDFHNGIMIYMVLECLTGRSVGRFNEKAQNDVSKMENLINVCAILDELEVTPLEEGVWTPQLLFDGDAAACWGLIVALAIRFTIEREIPPNCSIAYKRKTYVEGSEHPVSEKSFKKTLTLSEDRMTVIQNAARQKFGFNRSPLIEVSPQEEGELMLWVKDRLLHKGSGRIVNNDERKKSARRIGPPNSLDRLFCDGIAFIDLVESLTKIDVEKYPFSNRMKVNPAPTEAKESVDNLKIGFEMLKEAGCVTELCSVEDVFQSNHHAILRLMIVIKEHNWWEYTPKAEFAADFTEVSDTGKNDEDDEPRSRSKAAATPSGSGTGAGPSSGKGAPVGASTSGGSASGSGGSSSSAAEVPYGRDAFDDLYESGGPAKIAFVTKSLVDFANGYLEGRSIVANGTQDFVDGYHFMIVMAAIHGKVVDTKFYRPTPANDDDRKHNLDVSFAFIKKFGVDLSGCSVSSILAGDGRHILRLLHRLRQYQVAKTA